MGIWFHPNVKSMYMLCSSYIYSKNNGPQSLTYVVGTVLDIHFLFRAASNPTSQPRQAKWAEWLGSLVGGWQPGRLADWSESAVAALMFTAANGWASQLLVGPTRRPLKAWSKRVSTGAPPQPAGGQLTGRLAGRQAAGRSGWTGLRNAGGLRCTNAHSCERAKNH